MEKLHTIVPNNMIPFNEWMQYVQRAASGMNDSSVHGCWEEPKKPKEEEHPELNCSEG